MLEAEATAVRTAGLEVDLLDEVPLWPGALAGLRLADQGQVDPVLLLRQMLADAPASLTLHEGSRVTGLRQRLDGATVRTAEGTLQADHVLVATGLPVFDRGGLFALCEPQTSYVVALAHDPARGQQEDRMPDMLISAGDPTRSVRWGRQPDGSRVLLVGGEGHRTGAGGSTIARYNALQRWAREQYPDAGAVTARWSAEDFMSPDLLPLAGPLLHLGGTVHMVTGLSKWGMTLGVACASVIAQRILGQPLSDFGRLVDPVRVPDLKAGATVINSNATVARHMATGWAGALLRSAPSEPAEGEGTVGRDVARPRARCRVEGTVEEVSAVCPHLGGIVNWNDGDQTWDCPLHGSRFTHDGTVRHGPATSGLGRNNR